MSFFAVFLAFFAFFTAYGIATIVLIETDEALAKVLIGDKLLSYITFFAIVRAISYPIVRSTLTKRGGDVFNLASEHDKFLLVHFTTKFSVVCFANMTHVYLLHGIFTSATPLLYLSEKAYYIRAMAFAFLVDQCVELVGQDHYLPLMLHHLLELLSILLFFEWIPEYREVGIFIVGFQSTLDRFVVPVFMIGRLASCRERIAKRSKAPDDHLSVSLPSELPSSELVASATPTTTSRADTTTMNVDVGCVTVGDLEPLFLDTGRIRTLFSCGFVFYTFAVRLTCAALVIAYLILFRDHVRSVWKVLIVVIQVSLFAIDYSVYKYLYRKSGLCPAQSQRC